MSKTIVKLNQVSFSVAMRDQPIVDDVSYSINEGDFIILLGSNGSGKSSLIKLINRTYQLTSGSIELLNKPLNQYRNAELSKKVVTLTQDTRDSLFMDMSIAENGILLEMRSQQFFDRKNKRERLSSLRDYLAGFHKTLADHIQTPVNCLSGGERQILILALCLRYQPELILLDEHTSALDPKTSEMIMEKTYQAIHERHITCIMTTHHLDFALRYGNRLVAIKDGGIVHDVSPQQKHLLTRTDLLTDCY